MCCEFRLRLCVNIIYSKLFLQETSNREENTTASSAEPKDLSMEDPEDQTGLDSEKQRTAETVINFLMRIAASIHDASNANNPQCDSYVSRCISLLESAFSTKVWGNLKVDVRLFWMDKLLLSAEQSNTNMLNLISCVQLLQFCLKTLVSVESTLGVGIDFPSLKKNLELDIIVVKKVSISKEFVNSRCKKNHA